MSGELAVVIVDQFWWCLSFGLCLFCCLFVFFCWFGGWGGVVERGGEVTVVGCWSCVRGFLVW